MRAYIEFTGRTWRVVLPGGEVLRFPIPEGNRYAVALLEAPKVFRALRERGIEEVKPFGWTSPGRLPDAAWLLCQPKGAKRLEAARRRCLKILRVLGADQQSLDL